MNKSTSIACQLDVLSSTERSRRAALFADFQGAIQKVRELDDGYHVSLDASAIRRQHVEELVRLEVRCCAFLRFSIVTGSDSLALRITGGSEAKSFLASEFGLGTQSAD